MDLSKIIPSIKISSPIQLLRSMVVFNTNTEQQSSKVQVRLALPSGLYVAGFPIKMANDDHLWVQTKEQTLSLLAIKNVACVEILDPFQALEVLSGGNYFEISEDQIPTNLGLKRFLKSLSDQFEQLYGFQLKSSLLDDASLMEGTERYQFKEFLIYLKELLVLIAADNLGEQALKAITELQVISSTDNLTVSKNINQIVIAVNFKQKFSNDFNAQLKSAFESKL